MAQDRAAVEAEAKKLGIKFEGLGWHDLRAQVKTAKAAQSSGDSNGGKTPVKSSAKAKKEAVHPTVTRQLEARKLRAKNASKAKQAAKDAKNKAAEAGAPKKSGKDDRKAFSDDRGLVFKFKKSAPKTLNIDGVSRETSELIEDESVMLELVYGNSNFIEQIY